jgi:hypothetical protein
VPRLKFTVKLLSENENQQKDKENEQDQARANEHVVPLLH